MNMKSKNIIKAVLGPERVNETRWTSCCQTPEGSILLPERKLLKWPGGDLETSPYSIPTEVFTIPENAYIWNDRYFLLLEGHAELVDEDRYQAKALYSEDNARTVQMKTVSLVIPAGSVKTSFKPWHGIFFIGPQNIIELDDGTLITCMSAHFSADKVPTTDTIGKDEVQYKMRTIAVASEDRGQSWEFVATVAATSPEDPISEGFNEPSVAKLNDGRLLCVMRTGHCSPLYASWSDDGGHTWSDPVYTGLDRGCRPNLLRLSDRRLALSYGRRYPAGSLLPRCAEPWEWPGQGEVHLSISPSGTGEDWTDNIIGSQMGSCYTSLCELEPAKVFVYVDGYIFFVDLAD